MATDAESKDTSVRDAQYQKYTAQCVGHQTTVPEHAKDTTTPTTTPQTVTATQNTTQQPLHHKAKQTDCSHPREQARQYTHRYQGQPTTQIRRMSLQL